MTEQRDVYYPGLKQSLIYFKERKESEGNEISFSFGLSPGVSLVTILWVHIKVPYLLSTDKYTSMYRAPFSIYPILAERNGLVLASLQTIPLNATADTSIA